MPFTFTKKMDSALIELYNMVEECVDDLPYSPGMEGIHRGFAMFMIQDYPDLSCPPRRNLYKRLSTLRKRGGDFPTKKKKKGDDDQCASI